MIERRRRPHALAFLSLPLSAASFWVVAASAVSCATEIKADRPSGEGGASSSTAPSSSTAGTGGSGGAPITTNSTNSASSASSASGAGGAGGAPDPLPPPFPDFFVQDVCVDANTKVVSADPYDCKASGYSRRDIAIDEPLPYHIHDRPQPGNPLGFQMGASVPYRLASGAVGVLHRFDFGFLFQDARHAYLEFDQSGDFHARNPDGVSNIDGYDLLETNGDVASYIGTCDGGGHVQPMFAWINNQPGQCAFDDAWVIVDKARVSDQAPESLLAWLRIAKTCPADFLVPAYTEWQLKDFTYSSGKTMQSLVSSHYGGMDKASADHIERFYYTREYGRARWERWQTSGAPHPSPCDGPTQEGNMIRVDCRDWTFIEPDPDDGFDLRTWPVDVRIGRGNLLQNGDFGAGVNYLGPWVRIDDVNLSRSIVEESIPGGLRDRNRALVLAWTGQGGNSIYQDVPRGPIPSNAKIGFGARVWTAGGAATADLVMHQLGNSGLISSQSAPIAADASRRRVEGSLTLAPDATALRFELYVGTAAILVSLDDAWLAEL